MTDRLQRKIDETKAIAEANGIDIAGAPLLVSFEMPLWGTGIASHEISELARHPGTAVAATSPEPLPELRRASGNTPNVYLIGERGLVLGMTGGATLHVYPYSEQEIEAFSVALLAGVAPSGIRVVLSSYVSSGRQEVSFGSAGGPKLSGRELLRAIRNLDGTAAPANEEGSAVVVDDLPAELAVVHRALTGELAGHAVRVVRMPSGRFRLTPDSSPGAPGLEERARMQVLAQEIAVSCDRFLEVRGENTFGFVTEPVARWEYGSERGARRLAAELFGRPDTVLTHLGLHPVSSEGSLFFAYEGSETIWEAANKGIAYVPVRDVHEYARILHAIRKGES